jgi:hypothetical protein
MKDNYRTIGPYLEKRMYSRSTAIAGEWESKKRRRH